METMSRQLVVVLAAIGLFACSVNSQIGVTYCFCQPSIYTFTFNFSAFCEIETIYGPGVREGDCFVRGIGLGSEDTNLTTPVQVTSVRIFEYDRLLRLTAQSEYVEDFRDGDSFTYSSIVADPATVANLPEDERPGGIQLDMVGINALEEPIINVWVILFDSDCGIFPILEVGDQIGWTILSDLRPPREEFCPIAATESPTLAPVSPSAAPSNAPFNAPSNAPSHFPSSTPSIAPVAGPTKAPVALTRQPIVVPTATAEPTACIPFDSESDRENGGKGNQRADFSSRKGNTGGKSPVTLEGDEAGRVKVKAYSRNEESEVRYRYSKRHHFYFYGQQTVTARGVGHGSRPVAAPTERPTKKPLAECQSKSFPERIAKPPADARGPKLTKESGGMARRPRPPADSHGPKLEQPSEQSKQSQKPASPGRGKGQRERPTSIPVDEPRRHPDESKGKSYKSEDSKGKGRAPSPSPSNLFELDHSKTAAPSDASTMTASSSKPVESDKGKNGGTKSKNEATPTPAPTVVIHTAEPTVSGDPNTGFGVVGDDLEQPDDESMDDKANDDDSSFGNVSNDDFNNAKHSPNPPSPSPPTKGKGKQSSKKGSDHRTQRTLRRPD